MSQSMSSRYRSGRRGSRCWLTEPEDCHYVIKAILLGDLGVGKTSFLRAYLHPGGSGSGPSPSPPTGLSRPSTPGGLGSAGGQARGERVVLYRGKRVGVTVWDTAGQERYRSLTASYYRGAHACIVMYDAHNEQSFDNVITWLESVLDYKDTTSTGTYTMLVGTTRSACPNTTSTTRTSSPCPVPMVDRQRAENLAAHYQIPHFQVDSRGDPQSVHAVMEFLVSRVMTRALEQHHHPHLSRSVAPRPPSSCSSSSSPRLMASRLAGKTRQSCCSPCCGV